MSRFRITAAHRWSITLLVVCLAISAYFTYEIFEFERSSSWIRIPIYAKYPRLLELVERTWFRWVIPAIAGLALVTQLRFWKRPRLLMLMNAVYLVMAFSGYYVFLLVTKSTLFT